MRDADLDFLRRPYGQPVEGAGGPAFRAALGVEIPATLKLRDTIFNDLDEEAFGIRWWRPGPNDARRILISDYLVGCAWALETNLIEARLHLLEALGFADQHNRAMADSVAVEGNIVRLAAPEPTCAADELPVNLMAMHIGGLFRAVGSVLDCLGGLVVGVLALPIRIYRADLDSARRAIEKELSRGNDPGDLRWTFQTKLSESINSAGPAGWLEWANAYRNMLVHRGRRLSLHMLLPRPSLLRPDGTRIVRTQVVHLLTRDPERSDVETLIDSLGDTLTEPAELTLGELLKTVVWFTEAVTKELLVAWEKRRADSTLVTQPKEQWPEVPRPAGVFQGFEPGRVRVDPTTAMTGPASIKRLKAASMAGDAKANWRSFIEAAQRS